MTARSYREAVARYREALDLLGPYRGPCGICSNHPDARHRQADAIAGALAGGDGPAQVAADYMDGPLAETVALMVAVAALAADRRLHGLTAGRAAGIDREVWADASHLAVLP